MEEKKTIINSNVNNWYDNTYCAYRLPCGICEKLMRECPKNYNTLTARTYDTSPYYTSTTSKLN